MSTAAPDELSRDELYRLVWEKPATQVAKDLGVSGSIITRICRQLRVPKPTLGYWAKAAHGHKVRKPPLPPLKPGQKEIWQIQRANVEGQLSASRRKMEPVTSELDEETQKWLVRDLPEHKWIRTTRTALKGAWSTREGRLHPKHDVPHLSMSTSKDSLERALTFFNRLIHLAEREGVRVALSTAPPKPKNVWERPSGTTPSKIVMFFWNDQPVGVHLNEKMRRSEKPQSRFYDRFDYYGTGLLDCSLVDVSGYKGRYQWKDGKHQQIEEFIPLIIASMKVAAEQHSEYVVQREIEAERQKRIDSMMSALYRQQNREEAAAKAAVEDAAYYCEAESLRAYATAAEKMLDAHGLSTGPGSTTGYWLQWLRLRADMIDPLTKTREPWRQFSKDVLRHDD